MDWPLAPISARGMAASGLSKKANSLRILLLDMPMIELWFLRCYLLGGRAIPPCPKLGCFDGLIVRMPLRDGAFIFATVASLLCFCVAGGMMAQDSLMMLSKNNWSASIALLLCLRWTLATACVLRARVTDFFIFSFTSSSYLLSLFTAFECFSSDCDLTAGWLTASGEGARVAFGVICVVVGKAISSSSS